MTVQWAAELGIPEDIATKLADWDVAVIAHTEERFVGELRDAGMRKADATKAWDKLQERQSGTCAALCFAWSAFLVVMFSRPFLLSSGCLLSILLRFIRVPVFP